MPEIVTAYAGIGSRRITAEERSTIDAVASDLKALTLTCYSGNADGADIAFQKASSLACVSFLPWVGFNVKAFDPYKLCRQTLVCGQSRIGLRSIERFHPNPSVLTASGRMLMARNYHQVHGLKAATGDCFGNSEWPAVRFVLCCADEISGVVQGGTGQAVRIALNENIPVVNIRVDGWMDRLTAVLRSFGVAAP